MPRAATWPLEAGPRVGVRFAITAALLVAVVALGACGGNDHKSSTTKATPGTPAKPLPAKQPPADIAPGGGLAIGLSEINPNLFWHGKDVGDFGPWRDRLEALKPPLYRLAVDWASLQPSPDAPVDWTRRSDGCMRGLKPCGESEGIRDILRAIHSEQQAGNGFATMVVFYGVPDWAALPPSGCERDDITARSRPITDQGLKAYQAHGPLAAGPRQARRGRHRLVEPVERAQRALLHQPAAREVPRQLEGIGARRLHEARATRCAKSCSRVSRWSSASLPG